MHLADILTHSLDMSSDKQHIIELILSIHNVRFNIKVIAKHISENNILRFYYLILECNNVANITDYVDYFLGHEHGQIMMDTLLYDRSDQIVTIRNECRVANAWYYNMRNEIMNTKRQLKVWKKQRVAKYCDDINGLMVLQELLGQNCIN